MKKESLFRVIIEGIGYVGLILLGVWLVAIATGSNCLISRIPSMWISLIMGIGVTIAFADELIRRYRQYQKKQDIHEMKKGHKAVTKY